MSLLDVASAGSRIATLEAFRNELARSIDVCESARDKASLGRLFADVLAQIDELRGDTTERKETGLSDFEKRLRARESKSKAARSTKSG